MQRSVHSNSLTRKILGIWDSISEPTGTSSTYNIRVGRSGEINGPYTDKSGVALSDGGGTQILATHGNVRTVAALACTCTDISRRSMVLVDRISLKTLMGRFSSIVSARILDRKPVV